MLHLLACEIQYGGGPTLSHNDCCWDCLIEGAHNVVSADSYQDQRESLKQFAWAFVNGNHEDGMYYVSRPCMAFCICKPACLFEASRFEVASKINVAFDVYDVKTCEICHSVARNVYGGNEDLTEHVSDGNNGTTAAATVSTAAPFTEPRKFWQNSLLNCIAVN
ncbi:Ubiquitin carboxyl-terminal hydrolase [Vigna angularis]|uniref:Ubiquitin carboxyl-terminal hydrolase n=1 Tax=Phaseolus angularis TaxID=3914 RepID=A0A8T0KRK6_PHAAN|nr:uncharacterized protein LOC108324698 [Vigna angularis]KAG2402344.1 Ubiquitin carboxyl-terminal hydrolase [Vigna angularis]